MPRKILALILTTALIGAGFSTAVTAAVISTGDALSLQARQERIAAVQMVLARSEVRDAMIELGVDPMQAQQRVAALSDYELAQLQGQLSALPAGGILSLIGAVFVVLLILEVTGVIDIFKKV